MIKFMEEYLICYSANYIWCYLMVSKSNIIERFSY